MGRPPFGERAMTAAEKQARYRARKFGNSASVTKSPAATTKREARLEARIKELEAALAREQERRKATEARTRELETELAQSERKRHAATPVSNATVIPSRTAQSPKAEATGPRRPPFKYDPGWRKAFERLLAATDLPWHAEIAALHETLIDLAARKAPLDKITFRKGLSLLHSDRLRPYPAAYERHHKPLDRLGDYFRQLRKPFKVYAKGLTPEQMAKRAAAQARNEAFNARWKEGVRLKVPEKLPTLDELKELKRKAAEARKAERAAGRS